MHKLESLLPFLNCGRPLHPHIRPRFFHVICRRIVRCRSHVFLLSPAACGHTHLRKVLSYPMGKHISCLSTHSTPSLSLYTRLEPSRAPYIDMQSVTNLPLISRYRAHSSQTQSPALAFRTESQPSSWRMPCAWLFTTASSTPGRVFYSGEFVPGVLFTFYSPWTGHTWQAQRCLRSSHHCFVPNLPSLVTRQTISFDQPHGLRFLG